MVIKVCSFLYKLRPSIFLLVLFSKIFSNKIFILACMAKNKNKIKKYDQEATSWTSIHCESEMEKQYLQAGESQWKNSNSTAC